MLEVASLFGVGVLIWCVVEIRAARSFAANWRSQALNGKSVIDYELFTRAGRRVSFGPANARGPAHVQGEDGQTHWLV